jgi:hypothetical protein
MQFSCAQRRCKFAHVPVGRENDYAQLMHKTAGNEVAAPKTRSLDYEVTLGHVPLNQAAERLDPDVRRPTAAETQAYSFRYGHRPRPCYHFHLRDGCNYHDACLYDHNEVPSEILPVVRYMAKRVPCRNGSQCRRLDCIFGHICRNEKCLLENLENCSMKQFHGIDPVVAQWSQKSSLPSMF